MSDFAAWTGEPPDAEPDGPGSTLTAAPGSWLPPGIARRMADEDARERAAAKRAERERADRAESARDRALGAYREKAEARGEHVSAMALATGQGIGRSMQDVFADAIAAADHEDARQAAKAKREAGIEPDHVMVGRSAWPESEYELERMIRQAQDGRTWMAGYQMRLASRQGRAGEHIEAHRAAAEASRSAPRPFTGQAVRSEHCIWCTQEGVSDELSYLLHSDPERNVPVTTREQAEALGLLGQQDQAQERARRAEADRLVAAGFSRETAELAQVPYGAGMAVR